ncbi:hypothetical protein I553_6844 [Mycobacterium xenopi 4042]|uniref:Uncharacterized protein n=1 Tax=Mycobacterium xenopi 4042 TaxID=1299334 RepID=X7Z511_MYCXE|nr:hypothetical protein I553_6844 [Mycobacterium xenopi 4042]
MSASTVAGRRAATALDVGDVFVAEVFQRRLHRHGRAVAQRAERLSEQDVRDVLQLF